MIRRSSALLGAISGGLTALPLMALLYLGQYLADLPFVPFDLFDWLARVLPGGVITLAIDTLVQVITTVHLGPTSRMAKLAEQTLAIVQMLGISMLIGASIAVLIRRDGVKGWKTGAENGAGCFLLIVIIEVNLAPALARQPLSLLWLAVVFIGWGAILGAFLGRPDFRVERSSMTPADQAVRRSLLAKLVAGSLVLTAGAWGFGRRLSVEAADEEGGQPLPNQIPAAPVLTVEAAPGTHLPLTPAATVIAALNSSHDPAPGTRPAITSNEQFYRIDINTRPPRIHSHDWKLEVAGLFTRARPITLADLMAYPATTQPITIGCISNEVGGDLLSTSQWTGVCLRTVLEDLGLQSAAQALALVAADGFYESVPLQEMRDPRTLLVYGMNGETLPLAHGYPLRIYIPNHYGMKQPKWLTRIEAINHPGKGYWVDRGWNEEAHPQIQAMIDPIVRGTDATGPLPIGGIAWAGDRGIQKVEVQVDGGQWAEATLLLPALGSLTWVLWRYDWLQRRGHHSFRVRATDGTGTLQTEQPTPPHPNGATGYHMVSLTL